MYLALAWWLSAYTALSTNSVKDTNVVILTNEQITNIVHKNVHDAGYGYHLSSVIVSPDNRHVYAVGRCYYCVRVVYWDRDSLTGKLANQRVVFEQADLQFISDESNPYHVHPMVIISPDGKNVYTVSYYSIMYWDRQEETGELSNPRNYTSINVLTDIQSIAISPDGRNVYASGTYPQKTVIPEHSIVWLDRDQSTGTLINAQNFTDIFSTKSISVSPDGLNVYFGPNSHSGTALAWRADRDPKSGSLANAEKVFDSSINKLIVSRNFVSSTVSPDNRNLYTIFDNGYMNGYMIVWERDRVNNQLTNPKPIRFIDDKRNVCGSDYWCTVAVVVSPDNRNVYVAARNVVISWDRDLATGALTNKRTRTYLAGRAYKGYGTHRSALFATVSPDNRNLYVTREAVDGADSQSFVVQWDRGENTTTTTTPSTTTSVRPNAGCQDQATFMIFTRAVYSDAQCSKLQDLESLPETKKAFFPFITSSTVIRRIGESSEGLKQDFSFYPADIECKCAKLADYLYRYPGDEPQIGECTPVSVHRADGPEVWNLWWQSTCYSSVDGDVGASTTAKAVTSAQPTTQAVGGGGKIELGLFIGVVCTLSSLVLVVVVVAVVCSRIKKRGLTSDPLASGLINSEDEI